MHVKKMHFSNWFNEKCVTNICHFKAVLHIRNLKTFQLSRTYFEQELPKKLFPRLQQNLPLCFVLPAMFLLLLCAAVVSRKQQKKNMLKFKKKVLFEVRFEDSFFINVHHVFSRSYFIPFLLSVMNKTFRKHFSTLPTATASKQYRA